MPPEDHTLACAGGSYGDRGTAATCTAVCAEHFTRERGTTEYECGPEGVWIPANDGERLVCGAAVCSAEATGLQIEHANTEDCAGKADGEVCTVRCDEGYTGSGADAYVCTNHGSGPGAWSGGALVCSAVVCDQRAVVDHASECAKGHFGGEPCEPQCDNGYDSSSPITYSCGVDGQWTAESSMECSPRSCSGSPGDDSAHLQDCGFHFYEDGYRCTAKCLDGYTSVAGGSAIYTCGPEGQWVGGDLRCVPLVCGAVSPAPHTRPCQEGPYSDEMDGTKTAQCEPQCSDGYTLNTTAHKANYTCDLVDKKGSWVRGAIDCVPRRCPSKAPCANAEACAAGSLCTAECKAGYQQAEADTPGDTISDEYHCDASGIWRPSSNSDGGSFSCTKAERSSTWWKIPVVVVGGAFIIYLCGECVVGRILTRVRHRRYGTTLHTHQDSLLNHDGLAVGVQNEPPQQQLSDVDPVQRGTPSEWARTKDSSGEFTTRPPNSTPSPGTGSQRSGWFSKQKQKQKPLAAEASTTPQPPAGADDGNSMLFM